MTRSASWLAVVGAAALSLGACSETNGQAGGESITAAATAQPTASAQSVSSARPTTEPAGDAAHGKELVAQFECQRCHGGIAEVKPIADTSHCFNCHQNVMDGKFAQKADNERWLKNVAHLTHAPTLAAMGSRFRYDWLVRFIDEPHDLRPNLQPTMPRLDLSREQARDIATFLMGNASERPAAVELDGANAAAGRKLLEDKACGSCHVMTGVPALPGADARERETRAAVMLAPDLRYARDRLDATTVVGWLLDPQKVKHGTLMPQTPMTESEAKNIAAYLLTAELAPLPERTIPALPPVLDRPVSYKEVAERVLDKICRHCHGDPDVALGDGGPGNTGGFGFKPRGLNVSRYEYVQAGYLDDDGERQSVFRKTSKGVPRLVAAMMARHAELAGKPDEEVRGMPLGFPPIPIEDIQVVLTWIAQGRPR